MKMDFLQIGAILLAGVATGVALALSGAARATRGSPISLMGYYGAVLWKSKQTRRNRPSPTTPLLGDF
jgi:hypothetical protein